MLLYAICNKNKETKLVHFGSNHSLHQFFYKKINIFADTKRQ